MTALDLIAKKRDGSRLSGDKLAFLRLTTRMLLLRAVVRSAGEAKE